MFRWLWCVLFGLVVLNAKVISEYSDSTLKADFIECNVLDWGAKGDGTTDDTTAIRATLIACHSENTVHMITFPSSYSFLTGAFNISSNQILNIEEGSTILAIQQNDPFHYPLVQPLPSFPITTGKNSAPRYQGFISSYHATNIGFTGTGTIDGQGSYWWDLYNHGELNMTRPRLVELCYSKNITISTISMQNSAFWTLHLYSSDFIHVEDISIENPLGSPNTDGIDIDSSSHCVIDSITIHTSDDHISIKSGQNYEGYSYNKPSESIVVKNSFFGFGSGLAIGSETSGGVHNVLFLNNTGAFVGNGPRMKTCQHYGNPVTNIEWNGLEIEGGDQIIFVSTDYECSNVNSSMPDGGFHNIKISNVNGFGLQAGKLDCFNGGCTGFYFEDIDIKSIVGFRCDNVTGQATNTHPSMDRCLTNPIS